MLRKLKNNKEGFTIIEVMIVLAIAGLILLIVFLAVPALQRNARNTQRKNDIGSVTGAISEYTNNNNGTGPTSTATLNTAIGNAKLGFYTAGSIFFQGTESSAPSSVSAPGTAGSATVLTVDDVVVVQNATCNGNAPQVASSRDYVVLYAVETSSGNGQMECSQS
jgi:type IV pilus assembly protein PilA